MKNEKCHPDGIASRFTFIFHFSLFIFHSIDMINWKLIIKVIGILLFVEAGLMALSMVVGFYYHGYYMPFVWPTVIAIVLGAVSMFVGRDAGSSMGRKDGYLVVTLVWLIFTIIGMLPFILSGSLPDVASAFFESMSGFTSTGATVIDNCDIQPRSILFWRSLTQWIGGVGIVFFTIAILPAFGVGELKLFAAESTGPLHNKVHPRISVTAKWIGFVYLLLTMLCILSLYLCGMNLFDAVNYGFVTIATGGYGTHSAVLQEVYHSKAIEYTLTFFMFMAGVNYTLIYYSILKGKIGRFFHDAELRCYLIIILGVTAVCTNTLFWTRIDGLPVSFDSVFHSLDILEKSFRDSIFTVVSLQTTTGLANCDYTVWPVQLMPPLLFVMFAGACSGSSTGGFKCIRWSIIFRVARNNFRKILHPRAILPIRINGQIISHEVVQTLLAFVALFVGALLLGSFFLALHGVSPTSPRQQFDYYEALGIAMSSLSNVGPGMGYYGPEHSWAILSPVAKFVCSGLMLIGRLEIFPVLIIFTRSFWKKG